MQRIKLTVLSSLILLLFILPSQALAFFDGTVVRPTEQQVYNTLISQKDKYPEGMTWNDTEPYNLDGNPYASKGWLKQDGDYIPTFANACLAFAMVLSDSAFEYNPYVEHTDFENVRVGDILRINGNTHSVIVLEVHPDKFVIAEGNYNGQVHWGRELNRSTTDFNYYYTRYVGDNEYKQVINSIQVEPSSISLGLEKYWQLSLKTDPADVDMSNIQVTWSSTDDSVASVDGTGRVYSHSEGRCEIIARIEEYDHSSSCSVLVSSGSLGGTPTGNPSEHDQPIYRLFNESSGEHLYTPDANEYNSLPAHGWKQEGVAWVAPTIGDYVYRLWNPLTGDHLYTTDQNEISELCLHNWWIIDNGAKPLFRSSGITPIYRLYNPLNGRHLLTIDENEYNSLGGSGWVQEGKKLEAVY